MKFSVSLRLAVFYGDFSTDAQRITQSFVGLAADVTSNLPICAPWTQFFIRIHVQNKYFPQLNRNNILIQRSEMFVLEWIKSYMLHMFTLDLHHYWIYCYSLLNVVIWAEKRLLLLLKVDFLACSVAFSHFIWTTYCVRCRHDVKNKVTMTVVRNVTIVSVENRIRCLWLFHILLRQLPVLKYVHVFFLYDVIIILDTSWCWWCFSVKQGQC